MANDTRHRHHIARRGTPVCVQCGTAGRQSQEVLSQSLEVREESIMNLVVVLIILLLLFGGGGLYLGGPMIGGSLGGLILLILIVMLLTGKR